jgi:hypothetical protein
MAVIGGRLFRKFLRQQAATFDRRKRDASQMAARDPRILRIDRDFRCSALDRNRAAQSNGRQKQPGILRDRVERAE